MSVKREILAWLYRETLPDEGLSFDDFLIGAFQAISGKQRIDAESFARANCRRYWNALLKSVDVDRRRGLLPAVHIDDPIGRRCRPYHAWLGTNSADPDHRYAKPFQARPAILRVLDGLDDRQYEAVSCVLTELVGATEIELTPKGNERGIDLFALLELRGQCHIFGGAKGLFRIIGQCKQHNRSVEGKDVDNLLLTIQKVQHCNPEIESTVPLWFREASGPIIGWMVSHQGFQAAAATRAKNFGVVCSDSLDLAHVFSLSPSLKPDEIPADRVNHLKQLIKNMLDRFT